MDRIVIQGGRRLAGQIPISGAKNAALPIMTASLLTDQACTLRGVPDLRDIKTMGRLLGHLGMDITEDQASQTWVFKSNGLANFEAPYELVKTMRASVLVLGPLVARWGRARVSLPGGCAIGARPIDLHLKALDQLGIRLKIEGGYVLAECKRPRGADITFDRVTVTGTGNLVMAASLAEGQTVLRNAAREPEIVDLCQALESMGARIDGAGEDVITIDGVEKLGGFDYKVMPDRIEAGTYLAAVAMTGSKLTLTGCRPEDLTAVTAKFVEAGVKLDIAADEIHVDATQNRLRATDCQTAPFPGFPTDMQAQFMAAMCLAEGTSVIRENIFENRFMHVPELCRLGAQIKLEGNSAVIKGIEGLSGAPLMATDLRASACLVLAGLAAEGETIVRRVYHLDRGYERIADKLSAVGAKIWREKDE